MEVYFPDTMTFEEAQYYKPSEDNKTTSFVRYYQKHREAANEDNSQLLIERVNDENIASFQKPVAVNFNKNGKVDVMLRGAWYVAHMLKQLKDTLILVRLEGPNTKKEIDLRYVRVHQDILTRKKERT